MNADIMIEDAKLAHCRTMLIETGLKRDRFAQQRAAWECLKYFEQTPAAKADFHMKFASMAADDVTLLKAFYNITTDAELFKMICRFWNV